MDKTIPIKEGVFWISLFLLDRGLAEVVSPKIARGWIHFGLGVFGILYALGFIQTPSEPWLNRLLGASVAGLLIVIAAAVRNRFFLHGAPISDSVSIGQRLKVIENKITDPEPKAALSELRQEVERVRQPAITYENLDERPGFWPKSGERPNYVHLFFRNEETGGTALHA